MLFQHSLIDNIVSGRKVQTRRPVKPFHAWEWADIPNHPKEVINAVRNRLDGGRTIWRIGHDYAVQPGRGKQGLWYNPGTRKVLPRDEAFLPLHGMAKGWRPLRISVLSIRREDCRNISEDDAAAEGFGNALFPARLCFLMKWFELYDPSMHRLQAGTLSFDFEAVLKQRPPALYDCWALTFRVI